MFFFSFSFGSILSASTSSTWASPLRNSLSEHETTLLDSINKSEVYSGLSIKRSKRVQEGARAPCIVTNAPVLGETMDHACTNPRGTRRVTDIYDPMQWTKLHNSSAMSVNWLDQANLRPLVKFLFRGASWGWNGFLFSFEYLFEDAAFYRARVREIDQLLSIVNDWVLSIYGVPLIFMVSSFRACVRSLLVEVT